MWYESNPQWIRALVRFVPGMLITRYADLPSGDNYFICGRSSAFWISDDILLVLYSLAFFGEVPSGDIARYTTCRLPSFVVCSSVPDTSHALFFHWHYGVCTIDYFWSPFPCFVLCFFVLDTPTYMLFFHREIVGFYMRTVVGILSFWRHTTCIALQTRYYSVCHPAIY